MYVKIKMIGKLDVNKNLIYKLYLTQLYVHVRFDNAIIAPII